MISIVYIAPKFIGITANAMNKKSVKTSETMLVYAVRQTQNLRVVKYDGGSVKSISQNECDANVDPQQAIGAIVRWNPYTGKYNMTDTVAFKPVGILVTWDSVSQMGAFQYDGTITLSLNTASRSTAPPKQWSAWQTSNGIAPVNINYPRLGWVLAHRHNFIRIQIDLE